MGMLTASALVPAATLCAIVLKQRKKEGGEISGRSNAVSSTEFQESDDDEGSDLESFFMDYRLKQMQEKLAQVNR